MKKIILMSLCAAVALGACVSGVACEESASKNQIKEDLGNWTVKSPDGTIAASITLDVEGKLSFVVDKEDVRVVEKSEMGFEIQEDDFNLTSVYAVNSSFVEGSYDNLSGKSSKVEYSYNETVITLKAWEFYLDVSMRCYDDGYAFRYGVRKIDGTSGTMTVSEEKTQFALPEKTYLWAQEYVSNTPSKGDFFSYEVPYDKRTPSALNSDEYFAMPLLYKVGSSNYYSLISESELIGSGFYGSFLKTPTGLDGSGILQTVHTPAGCMIEDNKIEYPFTSPWRVGITGDMKTVNESELVEKVYDDAQYWKPDNYSQLSASEQATYNYDWVESGVVAWSWLSYTGNKPQTDFSLHREYVDLAADMGWKYVLLDGGWNSGLTDETFRNFMSYAAAKNIKVLVWCNAMSDFANGNSDLLISKLEKWAEFGVAGIKIDFFDGQNANNPKHQGEDSETIKWYEKIYQETARLKMIVNCHGANKPTGERRIYPHVNNREGVMGNEFKSIGAATTINELFVRNVVGPSDFTPVVIPLSNNLTRAHEMALSVLFESGSPSMADKTAIYYQQEINDFYKSIPSLRDKTVFLDGKPDYYYAAAIQSGNSWFVGAANGVIESTVKIDFSFLGTGEYTAEVFTDMGTDGKEIERTVITVSASDKLTYDLKENGGLVIRLTPKA